MAIFFIRTLQINTSSVLGKKRKVTRLLKLPKSQICIPCEENRFGFHEETKANAVHLLRNAYRECCL